MAYNKVTYNGNTLIDLTDCTVTASDMRSGVIAKGSDGETVTGNLVDKGAVTGTIGTKDGVYTIPAGIHNGQGNCQLSSTEKAKLIGSNIRAGITLFGVNGEYSGASVTAREVTNTYGTGYEITAGQ